MAWAQNGRSKAASGDNMDFFFFCLLVFIVYFGLYCAAPHRRPAEHPYPPNGGLLGFVCMNGKRLLGVACSELATKGVGSY